MPNPPWPCCWEIQVSSTVARAPSRDAKRQNRAKTCEVRATVWRWSGVIFIDGKTQRAMHATTDAADLARLISTNAPYDGEFRLRHPGVYAIKMSRPTPEAAHGLQQPAACIVASGAKKVMIGQGVYEYQGGDVAVYAVDLPLTWQITRATESE